jgi:RimJ/RimL family protein N-acetyltransferase
MSTVVETQRLLLREMSESDIEFVAQMLAHPEVMQYWPRCYSRQEAVEWIQRQQQRYARDGVGYWLAVSRETGQLVGQAGLMVVHVDGAEELGLGYMIDRRFWRKGYATEAAAGSRDYAFVTLSRTRIIALVRPENAPSRRVAQKLGMSLEGSTHYADYAHLLFVATSP